MIAKVPPFDPGAGPPGYLYMAVADHIAARIAAGELPRAHGCPASATSPPSTTARSAPRGGQWKNYASAAW